MGDGSIEEVFKLPGCLPNDIEPDFFRDLIFYYRFLFVDVINSIDRNRNCSALKIR